MVKWIEASGKNEEAAIASALTRLGLDRDDVSVEVLERAKSGFLGLGASPARVKVSYEAPDEKISAPAPVKEEPRAPEVAVPARPAKQEEKESPTIAPVPVKRPNEGKPPAAPVPAPVAKPADLESGESVEESVRRFLGGLLEQMNVTAQLQMVSRAEGGYLVRMEGEHLGALIGHRGETLDAIQQLTNYSVNRSRQKRVRIHLDIENYRQKREEALQRLAQKVAAKVVKYRRNVTLEPMNAYERHVIHETLQDVPDVVTYSTGTEPNRRTVVAFSKGKHTY